MILHITYLGFTLFLCNSLPQMKFVANILSFLQDILYTYFTLKNFFILTSFNISYSVIIKFAAEMFFCLPFMIIKALTNYIRIVTNNNNIHQLLHV